MKDDSTSCCGVVLYNSYTHICCIETIALRVNGASCCGNQAYNSLTHRCCKGRLFYEAIAHLVVVITPTIQTVTYAAEESCVNKSTGYIAVEKLYITLILRYVVVAKEICGMHVVEVYLVVVTYHTTYILIYVVVEY